MTKRPHIPERVKIEALLRRNEICCDLCYAQIKPGDKTIWEHLVPHELGGASDATNLGLAHLECAKKKRMGSGTSTKLRKRSASKRSALA